MSWSWPIRPIGMRWRHLSRHGLEGWYCHGMGPFGFEVAWVALAHLVSIEVALTDIPRR